MTLADRLALLPDYARVNDPGLHVAIAERAAASFHPDDTEPRGVGAVELDAAGAELLVTVAADAIRWS